MKKKCVILKGYFYRFENDDLVFFNQNKRVAMQGETTSDIVEILPFFDGSHSIKDISLKSGLPENYVSAIINSLHQNEIITFINSIDEYGHHSNFELSVLQNYSYKYINDYDDFNIDKNIFFSKDIKILGNNKLSKFIANQLSTIYNINSESSNKSDLVIAVDYFENQELFISSERSATELNIPFIRIIANNNNLHIGPAFIPFEGACYNCYLSRLYSNYLQPDIQKDYGELHQKIDDRVLASLPGIADVLVGFIKNQVTKLFSRHLQCDIVGHEYLYNLDSLESFLSPIYKIPGCRLCKERKEAKTC